MGAQGLLAPAAHECEYPPAAMKAILISTSVDPHSAHLRR